MSNLTFDNHNRFSEISETDKKNMYAFCDEYRKFIDRAKTEREFTLEASKLLEDNGFVELSSKDTLKRGDKVYTVNRGKGVIAAVIGSEDFSSGVSIVGSHIDSPRLDLKPNPVYEDNHFAYFKTHYYGGIKKYQWTTIPLALHGVATLQDGTQIKISIGEDDNDPTFVISDLLPHFARKQMEKKLSEAIDAESLNIIIGNEEAADCGDSSEKVKYNVLKLLNEKYDICEEDFVSAEIEAVPAFKAKDLGFDRSMVAAYGHDDRVCAYDALRAVIDIKNPKKTAICLLVDKEEIGSVGNTGMRSRHFENILAKMISKTVDTYNDLMLRETISNSICFSADVCAAFDPNFPEVSDKRNVAVLNGGIGVVKYSGSGGKSGASDASAELMANVRKIFNDAGVMWQAAELGKVDAGGGGTIAGFVANLDMEVVDIGVPLLSMHAPYEVAGKLDIFMGYKCYKAFFER
ncbi:MAG: aminopeptidase [Clostridiales bacterium]|nr:aminopeptidase [Clostridiales bacterium]